MRLLIGAALGVVLFTARESQAALSDKAGSGGATTLGAEMGRPKGEVHRPAAVLPSPVEFTAPLITRVEFVGLRHIPAGTAEAQVSSRAGVRFDAKRIESDVKALGRFGWFDDIRVETRTETEVSTSSGGAQSSVRVVFIVEERPFLTKVEFAGSKLLTSAQMEKIIAGKKMALHLGEPAAPENLVRVSRAVREALAELAHPETQVQIQTKTAANGTVAIRFVIDDGPRIPVGRVAFEGEPGVNTKEPRKEMHRTAPGAVFSLLRGKGTYTLEGFEEDRRRILTYYQNHGFPEARVGRARTTVYEKETNWWRPWKRSRVQDQLLVTVPIEAGPFYRVETVAVSPELTKASGKRAAKLFAFSRAQTGDAYSAKAMEDLRRAWEVASEPRHVGGPKSCGVKTLATRCEELRSVETFRAFDPQTQKVRVQIGFGSAPPYAVKRIEFQGLHRFSDRYVRRRIGLREGEPFDEHGLEEGLTRLARTGYFRKIEKDDIQVRMDEATETVDVKIRIAEAGQQHAEFSGGQGQFGSTLGIAYSLFDLLQREELLSAQLDFGPDSLQTVLGLVMEGFLGSRSSLAFSIFNNVLRPRLARGVKGPFYASQSEGFHSTWGYALTDRDSIVVNYSLSRNQTDYALDLPATFTGLAPGSIRADTSSSAVGAGWTHDTGNQKFSAANSLSGGWLGGSENVLRSNEEYARMVADPIFSRQSAWAFRTTFTGAGSYSGELPFYARLFSGDAQVRGLRTGEFGPYAIVPLASMGSQKYTALPAGANVMTAANAEYRAPLGNGVQGVAFFDVGAGWLLLNWLGPARPTLLNATNGILHGTVGVELRWTVPGIGAPVRTYYSVNVLRLNRFLALPDGTLFHAHNRLFAFGWALGNLF